MRWLLIFLISINVWANEMEEVAIEAHNFMEGKVTTDPIINADLSEVPGFAGSNTSEASLYEQPNLLEEKSQAALANNDVAQNLKEVAGTRPRFKIDPETDPLFKSIEVVDDLTVADEQEGIIAEGSTEKTCDEGGEDITYECLENRIVTVNVPIKGVTLTVDHLPFAAQYHENFVIGHGGKSYSREYKLNGYLITLPKAINSFKDQFCKGFSGKDSLTGEVFNIDCNRIQGFKINSGSISEGGDHFTVRTSSTALNITLDHTTYEGESIDEWTDCQQFEDLVEQGLCQYAERAVTIGAETRNINGYPVFKDDWQYKQIYHCKMIKDECSALRAKGCTQVGSRCKEFKQNKCWIYEQKYSCPDGQISVRKIKPPIGSAFCLTGDCHDESYQANGDMLEVMAKLSMLQEIQKDMNAQKNPYDLKVFKGDPYKCSRNCINFKDCCGRMKGWGVKAHLANCKPEEQQLAQMRDKNLCHQVGDTYCSKKVLGKCVSKKTSFCCFGTRFAKILQQQGRPQLDIGWGDAKCPDCRPLSIEELSKLDLSKMNFSELFEDLMKKYKAPNVQALQKATTDKITEHMEGVAAGLKNNNPVAQTGVIGEKKDSL